MQTPQLEFQFNSYLGHQNRTKEHEEGEAEVAALGIPYPEQTRTLLFTFDEIAYQIVGAIISWRVIPSNGYYADELCCLRCGQYLRVMPPNILHTVPLAMCDCSGALMEPVDERDRGLLELTYPLAEEDQSLRERLYSEFDRLTKETLAKANP